jgi:hypothetical protein
MIPYTFETTSLYDKLCVTIKYFFPLSLKNGKWIPFLENSNVKYFNIYTWKVKL